MTSPEQTTQLPNAKTPRLTRRKLQRLERESIHKARNWSKADVSIAEWPPQSGQRVVIKELKNRPLWFRILAGRYLLRREWNALCALRNVEGVPAPVAKPDSDTIVMEFFPGQTLDSFRWWQVPEGVVEKVEDLVARIHDLGITHGDLHGYNVLVNEANEIMLIDWATAGIFGKRHQGIKGFTFDEWRALDERAIAKIKILSAPAAITPKQHDLLLNGGSRIYRFVKNFKRLGERLRGLDEETIARREKKRNRILRRLEEVAPGQSEEERDRAQTVFEEQKKRKRERAEAKKAI